MPSRLHRAQELGQIRTDIDVQILVDQLWGAVYRRLLIPTNPSPTTSSSDS
ncbi:hypothetical protein ABZ876_32915 [Streptomyces sp. NPDC046931]|uniref:hypothetical protein n=1 Tax=Streptomyces sp. NPDC046931 TaxID=3154806 RepID=UPI0033C57952